MRYYYLIVALLLTGCSNLMPPKDKQPERLYGLWGGLGISPSGTYYPIELEFSEYGGTITYGAIVKPIAKMGKGCKSTFKYEKNEPQNVYMFREITHNPDRCINGYHSFVPNTNGQTMLGQFYYENGNKGSLSHLRRYQDKSTLNREVLEEMRMHSEKLRREEMARKVREAEEEKEREAKRREEQQRQDAANREWEQRRSNAYMAKKYVGQKVCMDGNTFFGLFNVTPSAYVENISGDNIQLRIDDSAGNVSYNGSELYSGKIIWDRYYNWRSCSF